MRDCMMKRNDGADISYTVFDDVENPKAALQIIHGMAEHIARYEDFARFLNANGYIVYGEDHRGHGKTAGAIENVGTFGKAHAWDTVVEDNHALSRVIQTEHPELPLFVLGHSMGSMLLRTLLAKPHAAYQGAIIMGTAGDPGFAAKIGRLVINKEIRKHGEDAKSTAVDKLLFSSNNKKFKSGSPVAWLSRDEENCQKYMDDPYCGFIFDNRFYMDLLEGTLFINTREAFEAVDRDLPLLVISGAEDPVGKTGKGVRSVYDGFFKAGVRDVTLVLYDGARHEILNETNKDEVYADVLAWMEEHL